MVPKGGDLRLQQRHLRLGHPPTLAIKAEALADMDEVLKPKRDVLIGCR
jgi:hypothetical protein